MCKLRKWVQNYFLAFFFETFKPWQQQELLLQWWWGTALHKIGRGSLVHYCLSFWFNRGGDNPENTGPPCHAIFSCIKLLVRPIYPSDLKQEKKGAHNKKCSFSHKKILFMEKLAIFIFGMHWTERSEEVPNSWLLGLNTCVTQPRPAGKPEVFLRISHNSYIDYIRIRPTKEQWIICTKNIL